MSKNQNTDLGLALALALASVGYGAAPPAEGKVLLATSSPWRLHITWLPAMVRKDSGELEIRKTLPVKLEKSTEQVEVYSSPPPPADWAAAEFDDSAWPRLPGPFLFEKNYPHGEPRHWHDYGLLCLRGRFSVADPAKAGDLTLSLSYRGGAVVYLNGKEVARPDMPEGKLAADTPALDYPKDAYADEEGKLLRRSYGKTEDEKRRLAARVRSAQNIRIPAAMLVKGVNVLGVELHRAPSAEFYLTSFSAPDTGTWSMLGLHGLTLFGPASPAEADDRKGGIKVLNVSHLVDLYDLSGADSIEPLRPVALCGPRNGFASGEVAALSTQAIAEIKVIPGDLRPTGAGKTIAASAVQIRYPVTDGVSDPSANHYGRDKKPRRFDGLEEFPPAKVVPRQGLAGAIQPVWITVNVPGDCRAGEYQGKLTVAAGGAESVEVPVHLSVADFVLPDPKQYISFIALAQSPDTLALKYEVPPWSPRHWELIERSLALLGRIGNDFLAVPLVTQTTYGNKESMVRWVRQADGSFKYDLSVAEKYVDLAVKNMGRPQLICLCLWEPVDAYKDAGKDGKGVPMQVTVVEPDGKLGAMPIPEWGTPESPTFWKPVFEEVEKMLAARGLAETMCLGTATQALPGKTVDADLETAAPGLRWYSVSHHYVEKIYGKPTAAAVHVYALWGDPEQVPVKRHYGWNYPHLNPHYPRGRPFDCLSDGSPLAPHHMLVETQLTRCGRGLANIGADFWPVVGEKAGNKRRVIRGNWSQLEIGGWTTGCILAAGRDGPVSSARFEVLREGIQEAETRIVMEKILSDAAQKARLPADVADRAQKILDDRAKAMAYAMAGAGPEEGWLWWAQMAPEYRRRLYAAAAEIAKAAGAK